METETDALRRAAPSWNLADDKRLLDALQKMHNSLLTKCNDTGGQLTSMCDALTEASLALDNVNNRFMSLSNSQFVERRVYDDDVDITTSTDDVTSQKSTEQPTTTAESTAENIKRALKVLESMHESVVILADSDSDSESEGDEDIDRVVLKPKDVYSHRPLPHIIGTKAWKSKWHAGLLPDDSASESEDTDASRHFDQYSDNERYSPESDVKQDLPPVMRDQMSTSSSEVISERDVTPVAALAPPTMSPADVAAELARRLQGQTPHQPQPQPVKEESSPQPVTRKLYKPEKPPPGTIFPDEPPPLDSSDHEDDIFAELRKNKSYAHNDRAHNSVAKDLFGVRGTDDIDAMSEEDGDIFSDLVPGVNKATPTVVKEAANTPTMIPTMMNTEPSSTVTPESKQPSNKKPVGGISMFGGGQHSAIGAAILQRQRQAASSDDTDGSDVITSPKQTANKPKIQDEIKDVKEKTQKDIFDDLFAKSDKVNAKKKVVKDPIVKESPVEKKVDLFSDNLFDDIDDIFTSNVVPKVPVKEVVTKNSDTLLLDDEDDLFRDIAVTKTSAKQDKPTVENKSAKKEKAASIFDSDDDLFSDKPLQKQEQNENSRTNIEKDNTVMKSGSIHDNAKQNKDVVSNTSKSTKSIFDTDDDVFVENKSNTKLMEDPKDTKSSESYDSKNIFADSDDDIFSGIKGTKSKEVTTKTLTEEVGAKSKIKSTVNVNKDKNMFEEGEDFLNYKSSNNKTEKINTAHEDVFREDDDLFKTSVKKDTIGADLGEKDSNAIMNEPKLLEDKSQVAAKQQVENILQSEDGDYKESEFTKASNNTHPSESESGTENTKEKENLPKIRKETIQDEVRTNEHVTVNSKAAKTVNVQFDDDEDIFKSVVAIDEEISAVTPKDIKPQIPRKPILERDQEETISNIPKDILQRSSDKMDNAKIFEDDIDNMKHVDSNKNITANETKDTPNNTPSDLILSTSGIFSEILNNQPPIFEKPKEPKRSKNVNALFDDDSDDEALFYRKSDATLDDVPSVEKKDSLSDDRFQLFLDEPPAIDENFDQDTVVKNNESLTENSDLFFDASGKKSDDCIIGTLQSLEQVSNETIIKNIGHVNRMSCNINKSDNKQEFKSKYTESNNSDDELFLSTPKSVGAEKTNNKTKDDQEQINGTKKVGKLKPMNLNINVNSLLPGALPRKTVKIQEQTDGQTVSAENLHCNVTIDGKEIPPSLVKSVSFDGDPDSTILDNKLSKERAKIKVKRRPSSRRARHEAARKSGIDFGQDSTDNSSSIDDILKNTDVTSTSTTTENKEDYMDSITCDSLVEDGKVEINEEIIKNVNLATENTSTSLDINTVDTEKIYKNEKISKNTLSEPEPIPQETLSKDVKSKVVYILSDEDIFNDSKPQKSSEASNKFKPKILNIVHDDDDIFKSITPANKAVTSEAKSESPSIKTLGNVYKAQTEDSDDDIFKDKQIVSKVKETKQDLANEVKTEEVKPKQEIVETNAKTSIFDDLSDEENELFNKKHKVTLPEKKFNKSVLFDSDSDSELFSGKSKKEKEDKEGVGKKEMKRVEMKASLFGDDDDDDLFGANSKKRADPLSTILNPK